MIIKSKLPKKYLDDDLKIEQYRTDFTPKHKNVK
jgi:hypothetical protein